jgi:hypothetical protein
MKQARRVGLLLVLGGAAIYVLLGIALEHSSPGGFADFKALYYGARCLIQHTDPYRESAFLRIFKLEGGSFSADAALTQSLRRAVAVCINLPTSLFLIAPFALLPWRLAHTLWMLLTTSGLFLGAFLMWSVDAASSPIVKGALIASLLAGSPVLFAGGNAAGIVIGLCIIAAWCFIHERFVWPSIFCMAISLLLKPHDAGLVWLFFLLAGKSFSKRALQSFTVVALISLPAILWVSKVAPQWPMEWRSNMAQVSAPGEINDPGPTSVADRSPAMVIDLQSDISILKDDPNVYNPVAYLICGALLLIWSVRTLRSPHTSEKPWLGLAVVAPLTILITYHHPYDAKLLLLSVPACAILWAKFKRTGTIALVVNAVAFLFTADIPVAILKILTRRLQPKSSTLLEKTEFILLARPVPLILLAMTIFYLCIYFRVTRLNAGFSTPLASTRHDTYKQ